MELVFSKGLRSIESSGIYNLVWKNLCRLCSCLSFEPNIHVCRLLHGVLHPCMCKCTCVHMHDSVYRTAYNNKSC